MSLDDRAPKPPIRLREVLLVVLGYLIVTWVYWEPFFSDPGAHFSVGKDYFQNTWNLWWTRFAWQNDLPFYECDWLFAPTGTSLAFHTITFANTLPGLLLQDVLGLTETHSVLFLSAFFLSALGGWALARHVTGSAWGAFLAGAFYSFNPYHTAMVTQLNNAQFQWIPLFLLALLWLYSKGRWWHVAWAGLFLALAGYADWYQPIFCVMAGGIVLLVLMLRDKRLLDAGLWLRLGLMGALGGVLMLPGALPLVRVMGQAGGELEVGVRYAGEMGLLGVHPQGSPYFHAWPVVLGWSTCLLLLWGLFRVRGRAIRPWLWLAVVAFVFLQGPYLVIGNRHFESIPMPMALFPHLPVLSVIRVPHRFLILFMLALAVLLAFILRGLLARLEAARAAQDPPRRPAWLPQLLAGLWCALILFELQPPRRTPIALEPPGFYEEIAADGEDYAVLELPLDYRDAYGMYLQTIHGKKILAGYTSHILPAALAHLQTPLMRVLAPTNVAYDVDYIPGFLDADLDRVGPDMLDAWRRELLEDKDVRAIVFRAGPDFPEPEWKVPAEVRFDEKLALALTPYRFNRPASDVEMWRQLVSVRNARELAQKSAQAREIVELLFGPPDRVEGDNEIWDLRAR